MTGHDERPRWREADPVPPAEDFGDVGDLTPASEARYVAWVTDTSVIVTNDDGRTVPEPLLPPVARYRLPDDGRPQAPLSAGGWLKSGPWQSGKGWREIDGESVKYFCYVKVRATHEPLGSALVDLGRRVT